MAKTIQTLLTLSLFTLLSTGAFAQVTNCGAPFDAPGTLSTTMTEVCDDGSVWGPGTLTGYSGAFVRTEYVFADPSVIVTNSDGTAGGPKILEINQTGTFDPSAYGLAEGDQFEVTVLHYELSDLQAFLNELFTGSFLFTSCCSLAVTFGGVDACSVYNSVGVFNGSDVTDMNVWVSTIIAFGGVDALDNIIFSLDEINAQVGMPCTDALPICYATSNTLTIDVDCGVAVCSSANPPTNPTHTVGASSVVVSWDAVPNSVACQVKGERISPPGPSPSVNILGFEVTSTNVPFAAAGAGTTWRWRSRCACSISPLDATAFSVYDTFTVPALRTIQPIDVKFFPNPATDVLYVEGIMGMERVEVIDATGRLRKAMNVDPWNATRISVSLESLEPGLYMLNSRIAGQTETKKFTIR